MNGFRKFFKRKTNKKTTSEEIVEQTTGQKEISTHLSENETILKNIFSETADFFLTPVQFANQQGFIAYLTSMTQATEVSDKILRPLAMANEESEFDVTKDVEKIRLQYFSGLSFQYCTTFHEVVWNILNGYVVIFVEGKGTALSFLIDAIDYRSISEPSTETIIRGPKEGFTESVETNLSLIRRRIRNPKLRFEAFIIGKDSRTKVVISYYDGVASKGIIKEVKKRIHAININAIMDSGSIEEAITDRNISPFPLVFNTERPDSVASNILEGKIAIIVNGSPFVLLVPTVLPDFFQSSEDYYQPFFMASFIRIVRYISFMLSLTMPSLYVAVTTFHHELIPTPLFISLQAQREGVPFPAVVEVLIMELTFEILREAGVRMPRAVGQTISIVGALVIGQAAVEAGLVSNVLIIVVAITAIASFVSPIYNFSISSRFLRFILVFFASGFGLYGILLFLMLMVFHLAALRSFGVPYLAPIAPLIVEDQKDVFVRFPLWSIKTRPSYVEQESQTRFRDIHSPSPPSKGGQSE